MDAQTKEIYGLVQQHLLNAHEELLGLHREGTLTYEQYAEVAHLLVGAQERLKQSMQGGTAKEEPTGNEQSIPLPLWLFHSQTLSPLAKWTYAHLLKLRRELCRPGRNSLVIHLDLVSRDVFPTSSWEQKLLLDALRELTGAGLIESRKMAYPADVPEHWEIGFLREARL
jgi:hypothetical protein